MQKDQLSVKEIVERADIVDIVYRYMGDGLKQRGQEYVGLCPFHQEKTPSFTVVPLKQFYFCHGCGAGGDALDFIKEHDGLDNGQAVKTLKSFLGMDDERVTPVSKPIRKHIKKEDAESDKWKAIMPVPETAPRLMQDSIAKSIYNPKTGKTSSFKPVDYYVYRNLNGQAIGAVLRIEYTDEHGKLKKWTPPVTYCTNTETGEERWILKGFDDPRPIYNMDLLLNDLPTLIVEGEKAADASHEKISTAYNSVTWPMGTNSYDKVDWSPLYGKDAVLWADNDLKAYMRGQNEGKIKPQDEQSGRKAMLWIKNHLEENGSNVILLDQPTDEPDGWDCADAVNDGIDLLKYIADHTPVDAETEPPCEEEPEDNQPVRANKSVYPLGYDGDTFYYYSKFCRQVRALKAKEHTTNNLLSLAESDWWRSGFQTDNGKVDWIEAASWMMASCRLVGIYDKQRLRGRGCWIDDNRTVLHVGDRLIVDGETYQLEDFQSNYVYQAAIKKSVPSNPLNNEESAGILKAIESLDWERPASAPLLAGFCVLAQICGTLDWRPHVWIVGGSGSGKSTVKDLIMKRLIGDMGLYYTLRSTPAGVQQELKADAFSMVIDEFVNYGGRGTEDKIQSFLDMLRDASGGNDVVLKGSSSGNSITYECHSMIALLGTQIFTTEQAVLNRTAQLVLKNRQEKTEEQKAANAKQWDMIKRDINKYITGIPNISSRMFSRTLGLVDVIHYNIDVFKKAALTYFGSARHADQYGTLLAGAYSLIGDTKVKEQFALQYIESFDWTSYTEDSEEDESAHALSSICQINLPIQGSGAPISKTIGEWIDIARRDDNFEHIIADDINKALRRCGIRVDLIGENSDGVLIANSSEFLSDRLRGKPWSKNWSKFLKRIIGSNGEHMKPAKNAVQFSTGYQSRAVKVTYDVIFGGVE